MFKTLCDKRVSFNFIFRISPESQSASLRYSGGHKRKAYLSNTPCESFSLILHWTKTNKDTELADDSLFIYNS